MPGINVSALSGGDLRRLLKVAHARRDGLLADRLEWEIAERATSGGHPTPFATLPDDDEDEPLEPIGEAEAEADGDPPESEAHEPAQAPRGVLLVTLGAVAGSLLSAAVFWGMERVDMRQAPGRAEPQPATAIATSPTAALDSLALLTPEPSPQQPDAAMVETSLPAATPPVEIAKTAAPAKKPAATKAALKTKAAHKPKTTTVATAGRPSRPPNLSEWLANNKPEEPVH